MNPVYSPQKTEHCGASSSGMTAHERHRTVNPDDASARAALRADLTRIQRAELVGRLAGGMAHELNNCLATVRIYGDLALAGVGEDVSVREAIAEIDRAAEHAGAMVRRLLSFGREPQHRRLVLDPGRALQRIATLLEHALPARIKARVDAIAGETSVLLDPAEFDQMILNLALNSSDAMADGGILTLSMRSVDLTPDEAGRLGVKPGSHAVLRVSDSGSGMSPETIEQIFEPFFTTKEELRGTGLGLTLVAEVVRGSGGGISVESEPGLGTTFEVFLPVAAGPPGEFPREHSGASQSGTETVLIVEDDDALRSVAARLLEVRGYTVIRAGDLAEARKLATDHGGVIDLLLTDVVVPRETARQIDSLPTQRGRPLKCLLMFGHSDSTAGRNIGDDGQGTLCKPFGGYDLLAAVRRQLDG
jgi:two-component system cell cycle sensor histidine kinase/response regulator CckA